MDTRLRARDVRADDRVLLEEATRHAPPKERRQ
jgi:hypothetical protein